MKTDSLIEYIYVYEARDEYGHIWIAYSRDKENSYVPCILRGRIKLEPLEESVL